MFDEQEFKALKIYIRDLRSSITWNKFSKVVFVSSSKINSNLEQELSLASAHRILQSLQTKSGKKLSSRSIRGSIISDSRRKNLPEETLNHLANTMSHSRKTADTYYDYNTLENSVLHTLNSKNITSTPINTIDRPSTSKEDHYVSSNTIDAPSTSQNNSHKRRLSFDSSSSDDLEEREMSVNGNSTLITLRTKKVKSSSFSEQKLEETIRQAIINLKGRGEADKLKTKTGRISTVAIVNEFPEELRNVSLKKLRAIIAKIM